MMKLKWSRSGARASRSRNSLFSASTSSKFTPIRFLCAGSSEQRSISVGCSAAHGVAFAEENIVAIVPVRVFGQTKPAGGIRLRIAVHEQRVQLGGGKRGGKIDGGRSLADAALLVGDSDNAGHWSFAENPETFAA